MLHSALKQPSPSCADLLDSGTRASEDSAARTQAAHPAETRTKSRSLEGMTLLMMYSFQRTGANANANAIHQSSAGAAECFTRRSNSPRRAAQTCSARELARAKIPPRGRKRKTSRHQYTNTPIRREDASARLSRSALDHSPPRRIVAPATSRPTLRRVVIHACTANAPIRSGVSDGRMR